MRNHTTGFSTVLLLVIACALTWTSAARAEDVHGCTPTWWQKQHGSFSCSATTIKTILSCYNKQDAYSEDTIIGCMQCTSTSGPGASSFLGCAKQLGFTGSRSTFAAIGGWAGINKKISDGNDVAVLYQTGYLIQTGIWSSDWGHWSYLYQINDSSVRVLCPSKGWVDIPKDAMTQAIVNHQGEASGDGTLVVLPSLSGGGNNLAEELKYQSWVSHSGRTSDVDGDGKQDVCGRFIGGIGCYLSKSGAFDTSIGGPPLADEQGWTDPSNYSTIRMGDINGDGLADVCARSDTQVLCYPSTGSGFGKPIGGPEWSDAGGWNQLRYYSTFALADVNGDGMDDVCARGLANLDCVKSTGTEFKGGVSLSLPDGEGWDRPEYGGTLRMGDINGDGKADVCVRGIGGMRCWVSDGDKFTDERGGPAWSDDQSWGGSHYEYWSTIRLADINGDGLDDLCARAAAGIVCSLSTGTGFGPIINGPELSDAGAWNRREYFSTIRFGDVDGDGAQDLCARGLYDLSCWKFNGTGFVRLFGSDNFSDGNLWNRPEYYRTITLGDYNGDGKADLCARAAAGWTCWPSEGNKLGTPTKAIEAFSDAGGWNKPEYYSTLRLHGVKKPVSTPVPDAGAADAGHAAADAPDAVPQQTLKDAAPVPAPAPDNTKTAVSAPQPEKSGCSCTAAARQSAVSFPLALASATLLVFAARRRRRDQSL